MFTFKYFNLKPLEVHVAPVFVGSAYILVYIYIYVYKIKRVRSPANLPPARTCIPFMS